MARDKSIKIRLTEEEFERIKFYAESKGFSVSEVIRDYIKRLPKSGNATALVFLLVAIDEARGRNLFRPLSAVLAANLRCSGSPLATF
jgi:hypothetical protein